MLTQNCVKVNNVVLPLDSSNHSEIQSLINSISILVSLGDQFIVHPFYEEHKNTIYFGIYLDKRNEHPLIMKTFSCTFFSNINTIKNGKVKKVKDPKFDGCVFYFSYNFKVLSNVELSKSEWFPSDNRYSFTTTNWYRVAEILKQVERCL